jgi:hypothetical protein
MSTITPTIGRKVWFWTAFDQNVHDKVQPFDATVIFVHSPTTVDLHVVDHAGQMLRRTSVELLDPSRPATEPGETPDCHGTGREYATWMPYQVSAAAKDKAA